jgi:hypothetical protein
MKSFEHLLDKDRRFVLQIELGGDEVCRLLQSLGVAEEFDLQDVVKAGLAEVTEQTTVSTYVRPSHGRSANTC